MRMLIETLTFRAPIGTAQALNALAEKEGRRPSEIVREALAARLAPVDKAAA